MIVLTDYPKTKFIKAHARGMSTEHLLEIRQKMFHTMMPCISQECFGCIATITVSDIMDELDFRGVEWKP
jgi:hypothetical protein